MKKFLIVALFSLLAPFVANAQLNTVQGGTGSTSPSGILYGTTGDLHLQTVKIGSNLTFSGGTLSASGGGGGGLSSTTPWTTLNLLQLNANGSVNTIATSSLNLTTSSFASANISQWTNDAGYLTANQTITLSGDVSGSGSTAITTAIGANKVTLGDIAQVAAHSLLVNNTGSTGNVVAVATSSLGLTTASFASANVSQWTNDAGYLTSTSIESTSTNPFMATYFVATSTTATSTFSYGLNVLGGCLAVNGTCISGGSGSTPNLLQVLTQGNDGGGLNVLDSGETSGTFYVATSTTATSTFANTVQLGNTTTDTNLLSIVPNINYPTSVSVGGALRLDNTLSTGLGALFYTNQASPLGRLVEVSCANASFNQTCFNVDYSGTGDAVSVTGGKNALSFTASLNGYALLGTYTGVDGFGAASFSSTATTTAVNVAASTTNQGVLKVIHTGVTSDANASGISIDIATSTVAADGTTAAQGLFITSSGSTTGKYVNIQNATSNSLFDIDPYGNVGIATSTPGSIFSVGNLLNLTTATSTFYSSGGINLTSGCFAVGGTCITGGGGGSGTVTSVATTWPVTGGTFTTSGTIAWGGLSTSTNLVTGDLAYVTGVNTLGSIAISPITVGSSLSSSGTLGAQVGGTATALSINLGNANAWTAQATTSFAGPIKIATTTATAFVINDAFGTSDLLMGTASTTGPIFAVEATTTGNPTLFSVDQYGNLTASSTGATPTVSSCGTSPSITAGSNNVTGDFTTGTGSPTACTITFSAALPVTPEVFVQDYSSTIDAVDVTSRSTTGFTVTIAAGVSSDDIGYWVVQP